MDGRAWREDRAGRGLFAIGGDISAAPATSACSQRRWTFSLQRAAGPLVAAETAAAKGIRENEHAHAYAHAHTRCSVA